MSDLPKFPSSGIKAPDGWDWFCYGPVDLSKTQIATLCPELKALAFLSKFLYTKVTYKFVNNAIICLRIYHILSDFHGSSSISELRPHTRSHQREREKSLEIILDSLEYDTCLWKGNWTRQKYNSLRAFGPSNDGNNLLDLETKFEMFLEANNVAQIKQSSNMSSKDRLLQIYHSIDSPTLKTENIDPEVEYLIQLVQDQDIPGLKTKLYNYQMNSVCKMLQVEMHPENILLPNLVPMKSIINGKAYYINQANYTFSKYPTFYTAPRGGILAEDMGLGKSLICIALTVLTRDQSSCRPKDIFDDNLSIGKQNSLSLTDYCIKSVLENNISWRLYKDQLPKVCIKKLTESPGYYYSRSEHINRILKQAELNHLSPNLRNSTRNSGYYANKLKPKKIWLSCSTLIICPSTLFDQWRYEVMKHVDTTIISALYLSNSKHQIFNAQSLLEYHVILISVPRFAIEESKEKSPLKDVLWKRLIIDEGHSMSSTKSRLSMMARCLHAERRWAVTGTPTPGLTRMSTHTAEESKNILVQFSVKQELEKIGSNIESFLMVEPWTSCKGMWYREVAKPFLKNQPRSDAKVKRILDQLVIRHKEIDISSDIVLPPLYLNTIFLEPSFSNKMAINLFTSVINVNAVTSEREDQDYLLNSANRSDLKRLMSNLQIASFYWSGFSEKELQSVYEIASVYMKKMDRVNKALAEADPNLTKILGTSKRLVLMSREEQQVDRNLLLQAMKTVKFALANKQWQVISKSHEMCYYTDQLPNTMLLKRVADSSFFGQKEPKESSKNIQIAQVYDIEHNCKYFRMGGAQIVNHKQKMGYYDKDSNITTELHDEQLTEPKEKASVTFTDDSEFGQPNSKSYESQVKLTKKNLVRKVKHANGQRKQGTVNTAPKTATNNMNTTVGSGISGIIPNISKFGDSLSSSPVMMSPSIETPDQPSSRPISPFSLESNDLDFENCQLLGTASAKLSYLISRLVMLTKSEKCIVFYEFDDIAFYISEALDIVGIKYLIYANSLTPFQRSKYLAEFHVNNDFRVLLMNVRLAAHGLNVSTASRVFFVSPIWRNDIESQAIKRAHRIGQRLPVYVETLVLKGTMEETIVSYRQQQTTASTTNNFKNIINQQEIIENKLIHDFIANHPYMSIQPGESEVDLLFKQEPNKKVYPFKHGNIPTDDKNTPVDQSTKLATTTRFPSLASTDKRPSSPTIDIKKPKRVKFSYTL